LASSAWAAGISFDFSSMSLLSQLDCRRAAPGVLRISPVYAFKHVAKL
jgi:hypothetical protein